MPSELKMPALSPTMEKGNLAKWLVTVGDLIMPGDLLAEIETDKATMELEAIDEGRIASLLVRDGTEDVPVGTVIALIADASDTEPSSARASGTFLPETPEAETSVPAANVIQRAPISRPHAAETQPPRTRSLPSDRIKVSPLALRIAEAKGIDLECISGSGPNGRIVRADLGLAMPIARPSPANAQPPLEAQAVRIAPPPAGVPVETVKLNAMRKTIARRLTEAKRTVPHFYLTARCILDPLLRLRSELNASLVGRGVKLSVNDMLMKAMALALVEIPDANVQYGGDDLHRFSRVDISMAVAIDGGLVTPIIRDAASLSLSAISEASKALAIKARDGRLAPEDYQGGTASISNLGMFGIDEMFPVINPPQALILGIGAGVKQPWNVGGEMGLATIMAATASFDHRAIDGAIAAQFMAAFRRYVENPLRIVG